MEVEKLIDLKAPRVRTMDNAVSFTDIARSKNNPEIPFYDFYTVLKEKYPHLKKYKKEQIRGFIKRYNEAIAQTVIENAHGVSLPLKLGNILVCTFNKSRGVVDRKTSELLNKKVYYTNEHTDGYGGGIYYSAREEPLIGNDSPALYKNANIWKFEGCRNFNRAVAKAYGADWKKYPRLQDTGKIKEINKKDRKVITKRKNDNEFEF